MWASRRLASEARLLLSQVVDRVGRIEARPPLAAAFMYMYRLTGGSISGLLRKRAMADPFTRLLVIPGAASETRALPLDNKIRSVPRFLQQLAIDQEPESNAKVYVNQRRDEMARTCKHIIRHEHFWAKYRYVGVLSNAVFNHFPLEGFSQTNGNRLVSARRAHFRQKLNIENSPNFSGGCQTAESLPIADAKYHSHKATATSCYQWVCGQILCVHCHSESTKKCILHPHKWDRVLNNAWFSRIQQTGHEHTYRTLSTR